MTLGTVKLAADKNVRAPLLDQFVSTPAARLFMPTATLLGTGITPAVTRTGDAPLRRPRVSAMPPASPPIICKGPALSWPGISITSDRRFSELEIHMPFEGIH